MSIERLRERLNEVELREDMSYRELEDASAKMNAIICEELTCARDENNITQFAKLLAEYRKIWYNKPGLCGSDANLSWADLSGAILSEAILSKANLRWANLSGAGLSGANLSEANLSEAYLSGANLSGADLSGAGLSEAILSKANLSWANLSEAYLSWANLSWANLSKANLFWAYLSWANLSGANLSWANLSWADLSWADLSEANLRGAIVIGADFTGAQDNGKPMSKEELEKKLAEAIKTPEELLTAINSILNPSQEDYTTEEKLHRIPALYSAALEIGTNGAKNREDGSVICGPHKALLESCEKLKDLKKDLMLNTAVDKIARAFAIAKVGISGSIEIDKIILRNYLDDDNNEALLNRLCSNSLELKDVFAVLDKMTGSTFKELVKSQAGSVGNVNIVPASAVSTATAATTTATTATTTTTTATAVASATVEEGNKKPTKKSKKDYTSSKEKAPNNEIKKRIITAVQSGEKGIDGSMSVVIETTIGKKTHNSDRVKHVLEGLGVKISSECLTRDFKGKTGDKEESYHENAIKITLSADEVNIIKGKAPSPSKLQPSSRAESYGPQRGASGLG